MAINRDKIYDGAMKLLTSGKFDKGIAELQKLLVDDPKDVRTLLKIAETLHVKMGNRKDALTHYDRAATIYSEQGFFLKAVAVFKQMLTVDATNPELHLKLAELYQQLGYGSQCLLHYQQVVVLYEQQEQPKDRVLDILKRMVDLDPENLASRIKVAELFAQAGKVTEAASEMRSAFDFLRAQQRYDDAIRVGERVLQFDPNAVDVAQELAAIYMTRQDAKQALAKLQLCFRVDPRNLVILSKIAEAFQALDQVPKTISVYKEIARIHEANSELAEAREAWERVLFFAPGDDDAEIALGRRAATVVASAAPAVAAAPPPSRGNPEDDQLQRLLTETDVYVKYGLRDKAIEHLEKIFSIRPDHLPGLEKLKQLQTQTKQSTTDTLRRLIAKGPNHPKVAEWQAELARASATPARRPPPPAPVASRSAEGEVILVEEDAPTVMRAAPRLEPVSQPAPQPAPQPRAAQPRRAIEAAVAAISEEAAEAAFNDEPLERVGPALAADIGGIGDGIVPNQVNGLANGRKLPPDEALSVPMTGSFAGAMAPPLGVERAQAQRPAPVAPEVVLQDEALEADADALVREALGMPDGGFGDGPFDASELSAEGLPADELVLEQEDAGFGEPTNPPPPPLGSDEEIDALAAAAVAEALPAARPGDGDDGGLLLSDDEMGELERFVESASAEGAPVDEPLVAAPAVAFAAPVGLPPEFSNDGDDDFGGERTLAYGGDSLKLPQLPVEPVLTRAPASVPSMAPPSNTGEFNPDEFDLPDDVKAMLAARPAESSPFGDVDPGVSSDVRETGRFERGNVGSIPSLGSVDAAAIVEMGPPGEAPIAEEDDWNLQSQSRSLFSPVRGFEDDPANTFFPDELAEAEFFIQQDLLDEAREILEPILEEVEDSLRVQHMLLRVSAKEKGEPEPPAPWEQRLIDDVAAQLDDMAAQSPQAQQAIPDQVSVEEVLSQFRKGIAETIPDDDAATHYDLGIAYREMGLLDDAVSEFEISARAPAKSADSWFLVALVRLDQARADDSLAALERAYFSVGANSDQRAAAEYQRGVVFDDLKKNGREALVCLKRSKQLGGSAPDLDRRIAVLTKAVGDVDVPDLVPPVVRVSAVNGSHKPAPANVSGRPKNIDYV